MRFYNQAWTQSQLTRYSGQNKQLYPFSYIVLSSCVSGFRDVTWRDVTRVYTSVSYDRQHIHSARSKSLIEWKQKRTEISRLLRVNNCED
jgi:hypothetical protein